MSVCIVSHDAGGAEILASYVARNSIKPLLVLDGPAVSIFKRRLGSIEILESSQAIELCDWVLCGTSWKSDLEWQAIAQARTQGKRVVTFLDHWVDYRERFIRQGVACLPDEIWVGDSAAWEMASKIFPELPITLVSNPYFQDIEDTLQSISMEVNHQETEAVQILYVCEPIAEYALKEYGDRYYFGYTEFEALDYFLQNLEVFDHPIQKVLIRPHPSESPDKYQYLQNSFGEIIQFGGKETLLQEICKSSIIVGCETMAMAVGVLAKKRVISCIPPGGKPSSLPHSEIQYLSQLLADFSSVDQ